MSYVDAYIDRDKDIVHVVERVDGKREFKEYPARYTFYYPDPRGKYTSIFGDKLERVISNSSKKFATEKKIHSNKGLFESDVNPVFRNLADNYMSKDAPKLNIAFFDIEVDFNSVRGFAEPSDPFNAINTIGVHLNWLHRTFCFCVKPKTMRKEQAQEIVNKFEDTILFDTEKEMLEAFLDLVDDADVLTGWNSETYDIPYIVNRITKILSKSHTRKLCLWNKVPESKTITQFGREQQTYVLQGRVHLDYLALYRKYTYHEMHSYSLDAIGEHELGERKVAYDGTLDQLYNQDFETFISYNRQDVDLIVRLDDKLQFIDLANVLAHSNTVLLQTTMGAVAQTDMAIINEAHARGFIVPDKVRGASKSNQAAGAYVATPKKGMHKWVGSIDLNSLYPSILRSLNMSTETIVGQVRHTFTDSMIEEHSGEIARAWEGKFAAKEYDLVMAKDEVETLIIDFEDGSNVRATGAEAYKLIFENNQPWLITANGTIFTYAKRGIVPGLLERWYDERKEIRAKAFKSRQEGDNERFEYWDKRQLVKKINLNSLYGALLNPGSRFFDARLGQSTTLTGRCIAKHMAGKLNEVIAGVYDHTGDAIVYGDTDSTYFSAYPILKDDIKAGTVDWSKEKITQFYEAACEEVNASFPKYMQDSFHTTEDLGKIIEAGREVVGSAGIFITKKRYAILVYDDEGKRTDIDGKPGKIKAMGLDLKRSDTPAFMQEFLNELLVMVLTDKTENTVMERILQFRKEFRSMDSWRKGTPKRVNNLTNHTKIFERTGKCSVGHALAAINWNRIKEMHNDQHSITINDGMKTVVCKLKRNPMGITSIGYPTDEQRIPQWFKDLPFDDEAMEQAIITKKIDNLLGVMKWDLSASEGKNTFSSLFELG